MQCSVQVSLEIVRTLLSGHPALTKYHSFALEEFVQVSPFFLSLLFLTPSLTPSLSIYSLIICFNGVLPSPPPPPPPPLSHSLPLSLIICFNGVLVSTVLLSFKSKKIFQNESLVQTAKHHAGNHGYNMTH